jgi:hypothetical protein
MVRYLLVDDTDGRVLAELASPVQAARLLARQVRNPDRAPPVSLVRLDHQQGSLSDITSMVSIRLLPSPVTRPVTSTGSPDRPVRHRPAPPLRRV